jgi:hypothetical protein
MILVPNRLLLLSGNKCIWLLLSSFLAFVAKATPLNGVFSLEKSSFLVDTIPAVLKVDTAVWKVVDTFSQKKVIQDSVADAPPSKKLTSRTKLKMACLVPLYSSVNPESNNNLLRMTHFTLGARLAAKECKTCKTTIDVDVLDIEKYKNRIDRLVSGDSLLSYDIIVGPYKTEDIKKLLDAKPLKNAFVFSPWNAQSSLLQGNPNLIQLKPGVEAHLDAIAKDIVENFPSAKTYVVCGKQDKREIAYFDYLKQNPDIKSQKLLNNRMELLLIDGKTGSLDTLALKNAFNEEMHHIYILPYWADHSFILKFLQNMGPFIAEKPNITIYGLPQWLSFPQITMDMYERFRIRLSVHGYYGSGDDKELSFKKMFFESYQTIPLEDAYYGYEVFNLIFSAIEKSLLSRETLLKTALNPFIYEYSFIESAPEKLTNGSLNGLENRSTFIMEFQRDHFQKVPLHD